MPRALTLFDHRLFHPHNFCSKNSPEQILTNSVKEKEWLCTRIIEAGTCMRPHAEFLPKSLQVSPSACVHRLTKGRIFWVFRGNSDRETKAR